MEFPKILAQINPVVTASREQLRAMRGLMSGDATFAALKHAVDDLSRSAPQDNDVIIHAFNISVIRIRYIEPHTFIFEGFDDANNLTSALCHFSQLIAHVVYIPKKGPERVVTGFARESSNT